MTAGALHGVAVALESLLRRGDRLLVEHPTYPNALDAARARNARLLPVAFDAACPDEWVNDVERTVAEMRPAAAYLMPDFQNPTGALLDATQRDRLARALRRSGTVAVVDETLVELGLDAAPGPPLAAFDSRHLSVGTLSKAFWGGMRVGWVRAEADVIKGLTAVAVRSHMSGPVVEQLAACHLLDGADAALEGQRHRLRARRAALITALRHRLPTWQVPQPAGGLVLWCQLPSARSTALAAAAEPLGLRLAVGPRFGTGHAFDDRLRLPYTQAPDVLRRAVDLLVEADGVVAMTAAVTGPPVASRAADAVV